MTKLTVKDLLEVAERDYGLQVQEQKSFWKITSKDDNRKACYVGKAKRTITRVDFSGFEPTDHEALRKLSQEEAKALNLGAVRGQILPKELREDVEDSAIMECYESNLKVMASSDEGFKLGPRTKKEEEQTEEEGQLAADED